MKKSKPHDPEVCKRFIHDLLKDNKKLEDTMSEAAKSFRCIFTAIGQGDISEASAIADKSFHDLNKVLQEEFDNPIIIIPKT